MVRDILAERQRGIITLGRGAQPAALVGVDVTSGGLLAIGGLVSAILLSTAVLVGVAVREGGAARRESRPGSDADRRTARRAAAG